MIDGVIGKSLSVANQDMNIDLTNADVGYPIYVNVHISNTTSTPGNFTFSIMDNSETVPSSQDNIFINNGINGYESINLGNFVLSPNEIISVNCTIAGVAIRVTGIQRPS